MKQQKERTLLDVLASDAIGHICDASNARLSHVTQSFQRFKRAQVSALSLVDMVAANSTYNSTSSHLQHVNSGKTSDGGHFSPFF